MTVVTDRDAALHLADVQHFFEAARIDPLKGETMDESGIDQLLDTMKARPRRAPKLERIVIHLPEESVTPDLAGRLKVAIDRYCAVQRRLARQKVRETRLAGQRALWTGFITWAICLSASSFFKHVFEAHGLEGALLSEGFLIAGWVSLWRPAELLLYDWRPYAREMALYDDIRAMQVKVVGRAEGTPMPLPD